MQRLEGIKRKIHSAEELQSIVKTMKGLAAASIHQFKEAADSVGRYFDTIEMGFQILLNENPAKAEQMAIGNHELKTAIIVFGSGQPMCGQFNEELAIYLTDWLKKDRQFEELTIHTVGHRVANSIKNRGWDHRNEFEVPGTVEAIAEVVQTIVLEMERWISEEQTEAIWLFYNFPESDSSYKSVHRKLFPVDSEWLQKLTRKRWKSTTLPFYRMKARNLFGLLLRQYFFVSIYQALAESLSAENASRLQAMQNAEKKIEERLSGLNKEYRQVRQNEITEELLDIISGFEAIQSEFAEEQEGG